MPFVTYISSEIVRAFLCFAKSLDWTEIILGDKIMIRLESQ